MQDITKILVAVDGSPASRRAVDYVANMVDGTGRFHVALLHVELPPPMLEWGGSEDPAVEERVESRREREYCQVEKQAALKGQALLGEYQAAISRKGADVFGRFVEFQEPLGTATITQAILDEAKEHGCGTVVVGRGSFSGLQRFFKHHVGDELVRDAKGFTVWVVE